MGGEQITSTTLHPHAPRREGKRVGAENTPRCLVLVTHWVPHVHQGTQGVFRDTKVLSSDWPCIVLMSYSQGGGSTSQIELQQVRTSSPSLIKCSRCSTPLEARALCMAFEPACYSHVLCLPAGQYHSPIFQCNAMCSQS